VVGQQCRRPGKVDRAVEAMSAFGNAGMPSFSDGGRWLPGRDLSITMVIAKP
jgi:hypothetical protein